MMALLIVLAFVIYWPSLSGPMMFDDRDTVMQKGARMGSNPFSLARGFRGLTLFTIGVNIRWPGAPAEWPNGFKWIGTARSLRAWNILLHVINGVLVGQVAGILGFHVELSSIIFIVLPFSVNTVAYISGRSAMLALTFALVGVLAILQGWSVIALPALALAFWSKEDAVLYCPTFAGVAFLAGSAWWWPWLAVPPLVAWWFADRVRLSIANNGDAAMASGGLPASMSQPWHGITTFTENLIRYPLWTVGLSLAPYQGSGFVRSSPLRISLALSLVATACLCFAGYPVLRIPLVLALIGPWLGYAVFPTPDTVMEYRNYHSAAGIALIIGALL